MKKRSGFQVMLRLVGLVRPLAGFMALAILLGLVGHLCAAFLTVLGGYALAGALGLEIPFSLGLLFGGVLVFAVARGFLRYGEQACNHFIAFKLLALLREKVLPSPPLPLRRCSRWRCACTLAASTGPWGCWLWRPTLWWGWWCHW